MLCSRYILPPDLDDTLVVLAEHSARGPTRLIAGGTDVVVEIEHGASPPQTLIDISRLPDLDRITIADGRVHVGPLTTHNLAVASPILREHAWPLVRACWEVGAPQIRNRGIIAGNLATASPANDTIPALWVLGADVTLASVRGYRTLSFPEFFLGVRKTALQPDEMIVDISFPIPPPTTRGTFIKAGLRRAQAISLVNIAVLLDFDGDDVRDARIAFGSVAPTIVRAAAAEAALTGYPLTSGAYRSRRQPHPGGHRAYRRRARLRRLPPSSGRDHHPAGVDATGGRDRAQRLDRPTGHALGQNGWALPASTQRSVVMYLTRRLACTLNGQPHRFT